MRRLAYVGYWVVLLLVTLVGLGAAGIRVIDGLKVSQMTSILPWGLWVSLYIYFIGLSAGAFLLSTLVYVFGVKRYERIGRLALLSALFALIAGLLFVWIDIGRMERFWTVFINRNWNSVLEWEIHLYVLYIIIILAEMWLLMRPDFVRLAQSQKGGLRGLYNFLTFGSKDLSPAKLDRDRTVVKILGVLGVPTAIGVHGGTGAIFAVVKANPYWFTGLFPVIFLVSALASGGGLLTFVTAFFGRRDTAQRELTLSLGKLTAGLIALDLLLLVFELLVGFYSEIPSHMEVFQAMMAGPYWYVFWIGQILLGAIIPIAIVMNRQTGQSPGWVGFAGLLVMLGIIGVRLNIIIPALTVPQFPGLLTTYVEPRLSNIYFPSLVEWLSSAGLVGLVMILFTIGFRILPVEPQLSEEV